MATLRFANSLVNEEATAISRPKAIVIEEEENIRGFMVIAGNSYPLEETFCFEF